MILLGRFTGEVVEDMVEVELKFNVTRLCTPVFAFPLFGQPHKEWIDKYKDKFMAVIAFEEENNMEKPLLIGLKPLKNNSLPAEGLDQMTYLMSTNFRVWMNDKDNELVIDVLNGGKVKLGDKNVTEHAMLGDKTATFLNDIIDLMKDLCDKVAAITVSTAVGPSSPPVNVADIILVKTQITAKVTAAQTTGTLDKLLSSDTVYLK